MITPPFRCSPLLRLALSKMTEFTSLQELLVYLQSQIGDIGQYKHRNEYSIAQLEQEYKRLKLKQQQEMKHSRNDLDPIQVEDALDKERMIALGLQNKVRQLVSMLEHVAEI